MPRASSRQRCAWLVACLAVACRGDDAGRPPIAPPREAPVSSAQRLLRAVGESPRGYARGALSLPLFQAQLREGVAQLAALAGTSPTTCGLDVAQLAHGELAIGEPLRVAAELRGIGHAPVSCVFGVAGMMVLTRFGIVVTDLTTSRGIAIDMQANRGSTSPPSDDAHALEADCRGDSCAVLLLGPPTQRILLEATLVVATVPTSPPQLRVRLHGPGLGAAQRAAIGHWQSTHAARGIVQSADTEGDISLVIPALPDALAVVADTAAALYRERNGFPDWDRIGVNAL